MNINFYVNFYNKFDHLDKIHIGFSVGMVFSLEINW